MVRSITSIVLPGRYQMIISPTRFASLHAQHSPPCKQSMARSSMIDRGMAAAALRHAFATLLLLWPWQRAGAAEYVVGDVVGFGWDSGVNYAAWAQEHAFAVGDVLVFQYVSSQHNVYEVSESTYESCDTGGGGNGVRVKYTSGYDRVVLGEARSYWFICDFPGHCLGGMKVAVNVSAGGGASPNVPQSPDANAASTAGEARRSWVTWGMPLGVLAFMKIHAPALPRTLYATEKTF